MNNYSIRYRKRTEPEDAITRSVHIAAPNCHTAWLLFEAIYPPKHFVATGITYRSALQPA